MTFQPWNAGGIVANATFTYGDTANIAALGNGGYVVSWRDGSKLKFQIYDGNGAKVDSNGAEAGTQGFVDAAGTDFQVQADLQAVGTDGSFVVTWTTQNPSDPNIRDVFSRKFNATGIGGAINALTPNTPNTRQDDAAMTGGPDGGWASVHRSGGDVTLVRYTAEGTRLADVVIDASLAAYNPDVAYIGNNRYAVTYQANNTISVKIYDATTNDTTVTEVEIGNGIFGEIVALRDANGNPNGRFVVVTDATLTVSAHVYTVGTDGNGPVSTRVASYPIMSEGTNTAGHQVSSVIALKDGGFAVAYSYKNGTDKGDIFLTVIDKDGNRTTSQILNSGALSDDGNGSGNGDQYNPVLKEMADGRLAVSWDDDTFGYTHVMTRIFDPRTKAVTVVGSTVNDIYHGSEYNGDELHGGDGNDTLFGGGGNDNFFGGAGADHYVGGDHFGNDNGTGDNVSYWTKEGLGSVGVYLWDATGKTNTGDAEGDTFVGIEVISGTRHSDRLEGDGANNTFWGDAGNDTLKGFGGNDTLMGVTGADLFYGGLGADVFDGGTDNGGIGKERDLVTYRFSEAGIGLVADLSNSKNNTWEAAGDTYTGIDDLAGTKWDDTLVGLHADTNGASQNNMLYGEEGNDILVGGWGADTLDGGEGFNFASYITAAGGVQAYLDSPNLNTGEAAGDVYVITAEGRSIQGLIGSVHDDNLHGSNNDGNPGHNELRGGDGHDQLHGLNGHDTLDGGAGNDILNGGHGHDLASYASSTVGVNVALPTGGNGVVGVDTFESIEGLIGSATGGDVLTGNGDANTLSGLGGNDVLIGGKGADVLNGGAGSDTVSYANAGGPVRVDLFARRGTGSDAEGDSYIEVENAVGSAFADVFVGNAAINVFEGGLGDDVYYVSAGDVVIEHGNSGHDKVVTDANYALGANIQALEATGVGAVALTGNALNNTITGNAAGNWIDGGMGADTMMGGAGDDTYVIDNAGDRIFDDIGANSVVLTVAYDLALLPASVTNITVAEGLPLNLSGTNGANVLMGNAVANTLRGLGGNDTLYGKAGNDKLYGGTGRDTFIFDTAPHKTRNVDKIYDFKSRDDSFQLDNAVFTKLGKGTPTAPVRFKSDMFVEGTRAKDREDRIVYDKKTGNLYYDADGTGRSAQVKIATLTNKEKLYYHDFFVI